VSHVINYDLPATAEAYTHRTGRTGRMERLGTALSLVTQEDLPMVRTIERVMGQPLERRKLDGFEVELNAESQPAIKNTSKPRTKQHTDQRKPNSQPRSTFGNRSRSQAPSRS
jgi:ATP-dependent RNA helicase RhlE